MDKYYWLDCPPDEAMPVILARNGDVWNRTSDGWILVGKVVELSYRMYPRDPFHPLAPERSKYCVEITGDNLPYNPPFPNGGGLANLP